MKLRFLTLPLLMGFVLAGCSSHGGKGNYAGLPMDAKYTKTRTVSNFNDYVHFLKEKAAEAGVSANTLNKQNFITYNARAVQLAQERVMGPDSRRRGCTKHAPQEVWLMGAVFGDELP